MVKIALCIASTFCFVALVTSCNNSTNPPASTKPIELLKPIAGASFKVGDTVTVQWKINDSVTANLVQVDLSIDGKIFPNLFRGLSGNTFHVETSEMKWVPTADQVSTNCVLRVIQYNATEPKDMSGVFSISN